MAGEQTLDLLFKVAHDPVHARGLNARCLVPGSGEEAISSENCSNDITDADTICRPGEVVASAGAPNAANQSRAFERGQYLVEVGSWNVLARRDFPALAGERRWLHRQIDG